MEKLRKFAKDYVHHQLQANFGLYRQLEVMLVVCVELFEIARPKLKDHIAEVYLKDISKTVSIMRTLPNSDNIELDEIYERALAASLPVHKLNSVYIVRRSDGLYKIGCSVQLKGRLRELEREYGELDVIHVVHCRNHYQVERDLHRHFSKKRIKGEWFDLNPVDIQYIKGYEP